MKCICIDNFTLLSQNWQTRHFQATLHLTSASKALVQSGECECSFNVSSPEALWTLLVNELNNFETVRVIVV